jgi:hypothetical protein
MSLSQLEQSLKSQRARLRCVRVNLRLWCALKSANLIAQREASMRDPGMTGLRLPYLGDVLLVLDPDLQPAAFAIEEGEPVQVPRATQAPGTQPAPRPPLPVKRPDSPFAGCWMGRY